MLTTKKIYITALFCFILSSYFFLINNCFAKKIDKYVISEIKKLSEKINSYQSYKYIVKNITYKKRRRKENILSYNFKAPLNIRIEWLSPKKKRGQIAVYTNGKMKAAPSWLPFVIDINPDSKLGMDDSNYPIYKSSLGALMKQIIADLNKAVEVSVYEEDDNSITYKIVNDKNSAKIKISKKNNIPVFIEQFDLKGKMIDGGYFKNFQSDVEFDDDFFNL